MYDEDYLAHHGIKGMKWGIRRFQNPDGTYTIAGRKRYGIGDAEKEAQRKAKAKAKAAKQKAREESKALRAKRASERRIAKAAHGDASKRLLNKLTDEELKAVNDRLKMEQSYKDMMHKIDPNSVKYFHWKEQASKIATSLLTKVTDKAIDSAVKRMFQSQDERDELELKRMQRARDMAQAKRDEKKAKEEYEGKTDPDDELQKRLKRMQTEEQIQGIQDKRKKRFEEERDAEQAQREARRAYDEKESYAEYFARKQREEAWAKTYASYATRSETKMLGGLYHQKHDSEYAETPFENINRFSEGWYTVDGEKRGQGGQSGQSGQSGQGRKGRRHKG